MASDNPFSQTGKIRRYCLDTNVFISCWRDYYSMDLCPSFWDVLDELVAEGRVFAPLEVRREIEKKYDPLYEWAKDRNQYFMDVTLAVQMALREVMSSHDRLVDSTKQRSIADPWVIAYAKAEAAVVVTKEALSDKPTKRIKIPDVCNAMGIPWMSDFQFFREVGVRFEARRG